MRLFVFLLLGSVFISRADEPIQFPIGLDSEFQPFFATLGSEQAFDPNRKTPHVLIITEKPLALSGKEPFLVSSILFQTDKTFPPEEKSYVAKEQYLWRWIHALGPDAVVTDNESLREALKKSIPTFTKLPKQISPSPARIELQKRAARSPIEIAEVVGKNYGHDFQQISYIPALAMVGRQRLAELKGENISEELAAIATKSPRAQNPSGPTVAGHLIFAKLGIQERVIAAAESGMKNPGDNEMSDSVFMICPMLAEAGRMTGESRYFEACVSHFEKMKKLDIRSDGLYRHSPLDDAAWGRGNGFPALGLAWTLSEMPESFSGHKKLLGEFQKHIAVLAKYQDASGMWHQVVDQPGSYREFTSTCMITFAMLRGMRNGWLNRDVYEPIANRGWEAIKLRISLDGKNFTDACTGTGKQKSLRDYFLRTAILGPNGRSGAMALMVATEREFWERDQPK